MPDGRGQEPASSLSCFTGRGRDAKNQQLLNFCCTRRAPAKGDVCLGAHCRRGGGAAKGRIAQGGGRFPKKAPRASNPWREVRKRAQGVSSYSQKSPRCRGRLVGGNPAGKKEGVTKGRIAGGMTAPQKPGRPGRRILGGKCVNVHRGCRPPIHKNPQVQGPQFLGTRLERGSVAEKGRMSEGGEDLSPQKPSRERPPPRRKALN